MTWISQPDHTYGRDFSTEMTLSEGEFEGWSEEIDDKESEGDISRYQLAYPEGTKRLIIRVRDILIAR